MMTTTCRAMVDRMLEADLDELNGRGDAVLAMHVRECARCRAVANRLVQDTDALGGAIRSVHRAPARGVARGRSAVSHRVPATMLIAVAASLAIIAIRPLRHRVDGPAVATVALSPVLVRVPPEPAVSPSLGTATLIGRPPSGRVGNRHPSRRREPRPVGYREPMRAVASIAVRVERTVVAPAARPIPVAPVKLEVAPRTSLGSGVAVDPPAGKRADIIRTERPGVTVIWLY